MIKKYLIKTESGSFYEIYENRNKLFILYRGRLCEIVGFANMQVHPSQFRYMPPEEIKKSGYEILNKIERGRFVIFNNSKDKFGYTSEIKEIYKV